MLCYVMFALMVDTAYHYNYQYMYKLESINLHELGALSWCSCSQFFTLNKLSVLRGKKDISILD